LHGFNKQHTETVDTLQKVKERKKQTNKEKERKKKSQMCLCITAVANKCQDNTRN
jgi:hypothetical protein